MHQRNHDLQYLLKTTGHFLARVINFHVFIVKFKTVKCDFKSFVSKKYKKEKFFNFLFAIYTALNLLGMLSYKALK